MTPASTADPSIASTAWASKYASNKQSRRSSMKKGEEGDEDEDSTLARIN